MNTPLTVFSPELFRPRNIAVGLIYIGFAAALMATYYDAASRITAIETAYEALNQENRDLKRTVTTINTTLAAMNISLAEIRVDVRNMDRRLNTIDTSLNQIHSGHFWRSNRPPGTSQ